MWAWGTSASAGRGSADGSARLGRPSYCDGYRLDPVNGSMDEARDQRKEWVSAIRHGEQPTVPEPTASRMSTEDFRDAIVVFTFQRNAAGTAWEVTTMYVDPERQDQH